MMDDKQKPRIYFDRHSSTIINRMYRILGKRGTVLINEFTGPALYRRFMNWYFTKWDTGVHAVYSRP